LCPALEVICYSPILSLISWNLDFPQRLGENISQLISSGNVVGLDAPVLQAISEEVVLNVDVLVSFMEDRGLGQS
jgi:hypothetical protein